MRSRVSAVEDLSEAGGGVAGCEAAGGDGGHTGGGSCAVVGLGVGCGGDRDGKLVDGSCGRDKGVGVVGAAVAVIDDSARNQGFRSRVSAVEGLREAGGGIASCEAAGGDGGHTGGGSRAVIGLGVGCGGDRDGKLVDGSGGRDKSVGVVGAAVAVDDDSAGGQSLRSRVSAVEDLSEVGGVAGAESGVTMGVAAEVVVPS